MLARLDALAQLVALGCHPLPRILCADVGAGIVQAGLDLATKPLVVLGGGVGFLQAVGRQLAARVVLVLGLGVELGRVDLELDDAQLAQVGGQRRAWPRAAA